MTRRPRIYTTIRFSDCDPFGHLYNVRYLDYLFDAREQHVMAEYPLLREAVKSRSVNWVVTANDIRYLSPVAWGEKVSIESSILSATRNSALLEIAMSDECRPKALLWSRLIYVNLRNGKVVNHPDEIQDFVEQVVYPVGATTLDERAKYLLRVAAPQADRSPPASLGSYETARSGDDIDAGRAT